MGRSIRKIIALKPALLQHEKTVINFHLPAGIIYSWVFYFLGVGNTKSAKINDLSIGFLVGLINYPSNDLTVNLGQFEMSLSLYVNVRAKVGTPGWSN